MKRKFISFSPYAAWHLHALYEICICHNLKWRGFDYKYVTCDGLFSDCDIFWESTMGIRNEEACVKCQESVKSLTNQYCIEKTNLGSYGDGGYTKIAEEYVGKSSDDELFEISFNGFPIADWVKSSVFSHLRINKIDLLNPVHCKVFRSYIKSGIVGVLLVERMLLKENPDAVLLFNGRMSITRIALELARYMGIRVVCHERGITKESLLLWENVGCLSLSPYEKLSKIWSDIPLTGQQVRDVGKWLYDRSNGKNLSWTAFSTAGELGDLDVFIEKNRGKRIVGLFTSSTDEIVSSDEFISVFQSQEKWINNTVDIIKMRHDVCLVIRVHPNSGGSKSMGVNSEELCYFNKIKRQLPENVYLVMPDDKVSTYELIKIIDLGLVYASTVGLEIVCRGVKVLQAARSPFSFCHGIESIQSESSYHEQINMALKKSVSEQASGHMLAKAYRFAYAYIFRWHVQFPLVKMPNNHSGYINVTSTVDLMPGKHPFLDHCVEILIDEKASIPKPNEDSEVGNINSENQVIQKVFDKINKRANRDLMFTVVVFNLKTTEGADILIESLLSQSAKSLEIVFLCDFVGEEWCEKISFIIKKYSRFVKIRSINCLATQKLDCLEDYILSFTGMFLIPINGECLLSPTMLQDIQAIFCANPSTAMLYYDCVEKTSSGTTSVKRSKDCDFNLYKKICEADMNFSIRNDVLEDMLLFMDESSGSIYRNQDLLKTTLENVYYINKPLVFKWVG